MDDHKQVNKEIINLLTRYVDKNPSQRFGQILFNLDINQFVHKADPAQYNHLLRDIHNDLSEDILKRVNDRISLIKNK